MDLKKLSRITDSEESTIEQLVEDWSSRLGDNYSIEASKFYDSETPNGVTVISQDENHEATESEDEVLSEIEDYFGTGESQEEESDVEPGKMIWRTTFVKE